MSLQSACFNILAPYQDVQRHRKASKWFDIALITVIVVNIGAMMLSTVPTIDAHWHSTLTLIEFVSVMLFTLEYGLRVWSSAASPRPEVKHLSPWQRRLRYIVSPLAIIDLLAILPFYLSLFITFDLRILRIFRVFRILKLGRYSRSMQTLVSAIKNEAHSLVAAISVLLVFTVIAATCIYYIEGPAQPNVFTSIPASLWWALVTLTTVGYGDVVPITPLGKIFGGVITVMGVCFYALPAGILSSSFTAQMQLRRDRFRDSVRIMLADGKLSEQDAEHIDKIRNLLDLDIEEAKLIVSLLQHHHGEDHFSSTKNQFKKTKE